MRVDTSSRPEDGLTPTGPGALPVWLQRWVDNAAAPPTLGQVEAGRVDWRRCVPFIAMHVACLGAFWVGWSATALAVAAGLYVVRMFFITGFYHRYFSHRTFRTSRVFQAVMAVAGATAVQRDPMWWAAHHVHHHAHSDRDGNPHSPVLRGILWSHIGWFMTPASFPTRGDYVKDFARYPELRFLNRFDWVVPLALALALFGSGWLLERWPELGTGRWQLLVWGFFVSTIAVHHGTFTINSLAHRIGRRRFVTHDDSRNSWWLALITLGEGWHNNHHHYPTATRQGFYWWEIDLTYYGLWALAQVGLIWDLRPVPASVLQRDRVADALGSAGR